MLFSEAVNQAMRKLAEEPNARFIGQSVKFDGATIFYSLEGVPMYQRIEMPVIEDFQMGFCIGMSLTGILPVCIFPRFDFLLLAANQLVNHLDKLPLVSEYRPKVIIRTRVGGKVPLDAGPQHTQDHTSAFRLMCQTIHVERVQEPLDVLRVYEEARDRNGSTLIIEAPC